MDGLDDYGTCRDRIRLLDIDQYRKYRKVLGKNMDNGGGCLHQIQRRQDGRLCVFSALAAMVMWTATASFIRGRFARFAFLNLQSLYLVIKLPGNQ